MRRAFVVVNPMAGSAQVDQIAGALREQLSGPWSYQLYVLAPGEDVGTVIASAIGGGADTIIAAGGDGTVRTVAQHLVGSEIALAILPEGTANVLAHDTGIPLRVEQALALVTGAHDVLLLDAIRVGQTYCFLNVSIGLSAGIIRDADPLHKRRFGMLAYLWSGARNLLAVGVKDVTLSLDGVDRHLRATEVLVANCPSMGLPELRPPVPIDPADGRLQVIAFRARHLGDYARIGAELLVHRPRSRPYVQVFDVLDQVRIDCAEVLDVQGDGDLIGHTPVTASMVPGAVRLIVPPGRGASRAGAVKGGPTDTTSGGSHGTTYCPLAQ